MKKFLKIILKNRKAIIVLLDIFVVLSSSFFVNYYFNIKYSLDYIGIFLKTAIFETIMYISMFVMFNIYNKLWRCANAKDLLMFCLSSTAAGAIYNFYIFKSFPNISISYCFSNILITTGLLCSYKIAYKIFRKFIIWIYNDSHLYENNQDPSSRFSSLIIESESNLDKLSLQLPTLNKNIYNIKGIITDSPFVNHTTVNGIKILGLISDIEKICKQYDISKILVSSSMLGNSLVLNSLSSLVAKTDIELLKFNTIEHLDDINQAKIVPKELDITKLLGRKVVDFKMSNINFIKNKIVLVTGGGGSIGSELCRQVLNCSPKKLIILDNYENNAYSIEQELIRTHGNNIDICVEIASVQDSDKIEKIFKIHSPELVFHAAAHKHVPLMEHNPEESIKNNVFGTLNVAQISDKYNAEKFILISTDKAVNPTNIMGATKRIAEMIIQYYSKISCTNFVAVRFGNVLGSNGSVIPLFKKQIESGGPVTVTHPNITRYFMTISEAVSLILQAGQLAKGGEIFVLDMGQPVKIRKLAENMIKLYGLTLDKDIKIDYIGLRPGEKLYEELLMAEEGLEKTNNKKIFIGKPIEFEIAKFLKHLEQLKELATTNQSEEIFKIMPLVVDTYNNKSTSVSASMSKTI